MSRQPVRTSVLVVNFGSHELIATNFAGLGDEFDLVVVDNFHSAVERDAITALCAERGWALIGEPTNLGFAAAVNVGVRQLRQQVGDGGADAGVLLVNPDAVLTPAVARALAEQLQDEPMALISPRIVSSSGMPYFHGSRVELASGRMWSRPRPGPDTPARLYPADSSEPGLRDWLSGACLAFTTTLWQAAGGWSERYFLYWEDVDFAARCVAAGARLCVRNDLVVVHDEGATHGAQRSRARSTTYYYFNCRNRLTYAAEHLGGRGRLSWALRTPAESWQILLRGGKRQILESPQTLWSAVRGSLAGLWLLLRSVRSGRSC